MSVYPFIEAEKAEQVGTVAKACELLEVSRSASTTGPTTSRPVASSTKAPWASGSRRSTTAPVAPTAGRGCTGRYATRVFMPVASGWRASCARRPWWDGAGGGGP